MNLIETTIEWRGYPIKIRGNKIIVPCFGTTYLNQKMHWSYTEISFDNLNQDLREHLVKNKLYTK